MSYTPPNGLEADFQLNEYTPPNGLLADFQLEDSVGIEVNTLPAQNITTNSVRFRGEITGVAL